MEGYGSRKYFFSSGQWSKNHIFNRGQPQKDVVKHLTKNSQLVRVENFYIFFLGSQGSTDQKRSVPDQSNFRNEG